MKPRFELFDLVSGNVLDIYDHETDAIDALIEIASESGTGAIARFALTRERNGDSFLIAMGDDLVRLVSAKAPNLDPIEELTVGSKA